MATKAREAFWNVALGNNSKLANLAKLAIKEAEDEAQQRTWVGLTDEEIGKIYTPFSSAFDFARAIEAKLKEKNT